VTVLGITIDASASSTPVQVNGRANLSATVSPNVSGVSVIFTITNEADAVVYTFTGTTDTNGVVTGTSSTLSIIGVYKVLAEVGSGCSNSTAYIPVFDPNGTFVTGGGWINSPSGAYALNKSLVGKANFGFVSKYKKGSTQVDGNTEFQFQAGSLNFKSTLHESGSLVISGNKATYRGDGSINGENGYKFTLVATDGQYNGGTAADRFRIKIWGSNGVVYDNGVKIDGTYYDENDTEINSLTELGGGSIVIHSSKSTKRDGNEVDDTIITNDILSNSISLYPNPVDDVIQVTYFSNDERVVDFTLFDLQGRRLKTQNYPASPQGKYQMSVGELNMQSGFYLLRISQGTAAKTLKVLKR
jgi:hypothetical protein